MLSKLYLYEKFAKSVEKGICETKEWFDFLIPQSCQEHFPSNNTAGICKPGKVSSTKKFLIRLTHKPLYAHIMVLCFMIKLLFHLDPETTHSDVGGFLTASFVIPSQMLMCGVIKAMGHLIKFVLNCGIGSSHKREYSLHCASMEKSAELPNMNMLFFLAAIVGFILLFLAEASVINYMVNVVFIQMFLMACVVAGGKIAPFSFITQKEISAVYGRYEPKYNLPEKILPHINASVLGMLLADTWHFTWPSFNHLILCLVNR